MKRRIIKKNKKKFTLGGFCEEYIWAIEKQSNGFKYHETNERNDALEFYTKKSAYKYLKNLGISKYQRDEIHVWHDKQIEDSKKEWALDEMNQNLTEHIKK